MGSSFTNYQIRISSNQPVIEAVKSLAEGKACVSKAKQGWVTLLDELSESQSEEQMCRLAQGLSQQLATTVFGFMI